MKPEAAAARGGAPRPSGRPKRRSKNFSKEKPRGVANGRFRLSSCARPTVTATTLGDSASTRSAKPSGAGRADAALAANRAMTAAAAARAGSFEDARVM